MIRILAFSAFLLSALAAHATTLIYQGSVYTQTSYAPPPPEAILSSGPPLRGPYDTTMAVSASFFIDAPLAPNTAYSFSDIAGPIAWSILSMSEGLNDFLAVGGLFPALNFTTDATAQIASWNWSSLAITGEFVQSTSTSGDAASYQADYQFTDATGAITCCVSEIGSASTPATGTWTIIPGPTVIPLPASGLLLLGSLAGFAALRRRV